MDIAAHLFKFGCLVIVVSFVLGVALTGLIIWAVAHFINKVW